MGEFSKRQVLYIHINTPYSDTRLSFGSTHLAHVSQSLKLAETYTWEIILLPTIARSSSKIWYFPTQWKFPKHDERLEMGVDDLFDVASHDAYYRVDLSLCVIQTNLSMFTPFSTHMLELLTY